MPREYEPWVHPARRRIPLAEEPLLPAASGRVIPARTVGDQAVNRVFFPFPLSYLDSSPSRSLGRLLDSTALLLIAQRSSFAALAFNRESLDACNQHLLPEIGSKPLVVQWVVRNLLLRANHQDLRAWPCPPDVLTGGTELE